MYEKSFSAISERYFKASPWPSVEAIARFADNDHVFCLLYKEMYFRHVYSKVGWCAAEKGVDQHHRGIGGFFFFFFFSSVFFSLSFSVHIFHLIFFFVAREKSHEPLEREDERERQRLNRCILNKRSECVGSRAIGEREKRRLSGGSRKKKKMID